MTRRHCAAWLLAVCGAMAAPLAAQRTPEQRYFDWTALPFPPAEFAARQTTLATTLVPVAVASSSRRRHLGSRRVSRSASSIRSGT